MSKILKRLSKLLEDPKNPCLGPHIRLLKFTGLWVGDMKSFSSRMKLVLFYTTIIFFFSQYIKCLISLNPDSLKLILQYAPFHMGVAKCCFFKTNYKSWERLVKYISTVEQSQMSKGDLKGNNIMNDYINRSRRVTYFFWALAIFSNFSIFTEPYQKNQIVGNGTNVYLYIFDGYTPFRREPPGYYCSMFIQTVLGHLMSAYVVGWDMFTVSIMIFFVGQLKMSQLYCKNSIDTQNNSKSYENIKKCHQFHTKLVYYQKEFNSMISSVMCIYLLVISVNLGVCIIQIAEIDDDLAALVSSCFYILACLIQLLLFYWHGSEVTVESEFVSYSVFESDWPEADQHLQKQIALLGLTTRKRLTFRAGPLNEMSLSTFVSILRASYSFYTLLNGTN